MALRDSLQNNLYCARGYLQTEVLPDKEGDIFVRELTKVVIDEYLENEGTKVVKVIFALIYVYL